MITKLFQLMSIFGFTQAYVHTNYSSEFNTNPTLRTGLIKEFCNTSFPGTLNTMKKFDFRGIANRAILFLNIKANTVTTFDLILN